MAQLPLQQDLSLLQTKWKSVLDPLIANPMNNGVLLQGIPLKSGATAINHKLGRMPQGWYIADINGSANVYRSQPLNDLTLTLTSSAAVTVNLVVF